jgi:hypothetical protein
MTGIVDCCCASARKGHATAPPSTVMNSRRLMIFLGRPMRQTYHIEVLFVVHHS